MKPQATYFPKNLNHPEIKQIIGDGVCTKPCRWNSPTSSTYKNLCSKNGGFDLRITFNFTAKQCLEYTHFRLHPKHICYETDAVYHKNLAHMESLPIHHEDEFGQYRVLDKVYAHKIKPRFDRIWAFEHFDVYFIKPEYLQGMLQKFSGLVETPILHHNTGEPLLEWKSFNASTWLQSFERNETTELIQLDHGKQGIRSLGLLAAEERDLMSLPDVARSPGADFKGDSGYIVSRDVWSYWQALGINSFIPEPVLTVGSKGYESYMQLWAEIKESLGLNPENSLRRY